MENKRIKKTKNIGKYLNIPFQMLAVIALGVFAGIKLDDLLNFDLPIFTVLLSVVAVVLAIYSAIKDFLK